jgi:hypothetical protein
MRKTSNIEFVSPDLESELVELFASGEPFHSLLHQNQRNAFASFCSRIRLGAHNHCNLLSLNVPYLSPFLPTSAMAPLVMKVLDPFKERSDDPAFGRAEVFMPLSQFLLFKKVNFFF